MKYHQKLFYNWNIKLIFIAEIGLNYNSNVGLLHELIRQAKLAGADIVKFQLGWRGKKMK